MVRDVVCLTVSESSFGSELIVDVMVQHKLYTCIWHVCTGSVSYVVLLPFLSFCFLHLNPVHIKSREFLKIAAVLTLEYLLLLEFNLQT